MNKTYGVTQISKKILMLLVNVLIALLSLFCLFPVVWMIYSSLKDEPSFFKESDRASHFLSFQQLSVSH